MLNYMPNTVTLINLNIQTSFDWGYKHGLKLNESKTNSIVIGYNKLISNLNLATDPNLQTTSLLTIHHNCIYKKQIIMTVPLSL